jgi:hypothetical protein
VITGDKGKVEKENEGVRSLEGRAGITIKEEK